MRQTRTVSLDTLEYLYIPDVTYATYGETQRKMQLIIPYQIGRASCRERV